MRTAKIEQLRAMLEGATPGACVHHMREPLDCHELAELLGELLALRKLRGKALAVYNTHPSKTKRAMVAAREFPPAYLAAQAPEVKARALGLARRKAAQSGRELPIGYEELSGAEGIAFVVAAQVELKTEIATGVSHGR